jgi:hypothetical protein
MPAAKEFAISIGDQPGLLGKASAAAGCLVRRTSPYPAITHNAARPWDQCAWRGARGCSLPPGQSELLLPSLRPM